MSFLYTHKFSDLRQSSSSDSSRQSALPSQTKIEGKQISSAQAVVQLWQGSGVAVGDATKMEENINQIKSKKNHIISSYVLEY